LTSNKERDLHKKILLETNQKWISVASQIVSLSNHVIVLFTTLVDRHYLQYIKRCLSRGGNI